MVEKKRLIFLLPFLINLALIFSSSSVSSYIEQQTLEKSFTLVPVWIFYLTGTALGPALIYLIRLLPDPAYAVFAGGFLATLGLLLTGTTPGATQFVSFGLLASCGTCLAFIASCMGLSPFFVGPNRFITVFILLFGTILMMMQHAITGSLLHDFEVDTFYIVSPIIFISSMIPIILVFKKQDVYRTDFDKCCDEEEPLCEKGEPTLCCGSHCGTMGRWMFSNEWLLSFLAVMVWISWGIGVDTTWLSLFLMPNIDTTWLTPGWILQDDFKLNIIILQVLFSIIVCMIKLYTRLNATLHSGPGGDIMFSSNYMFLSLIGVVGLAFSLFPDIMDPIHNQILFSYTFALQFDDLCDLEIQRKLPCSSCVAQASEKCEKTAKYWRRRLGCFFSTTGIVFSLVTITSMAMLLGLQFANMAGYFVKLVQDSTLFSREGLGLVSLISVTISLLQPHTWLRKQDAIHPHPTNL